MLIGALSMLSTPAVGEPDFGRYIVTLKDGADSNVLSQRLTKQAGGKRGYVYSNALTGFSIEMPKAALNGLRNHPKVLLVEEDLAQLEHYAARGVRVMTLTWNNHLSWARSCQDGAPAGTPEGLSSFGREVVTRMGELGMRADLSHAAERTFYDALECEGPAPLVTHSGCKALSNHPRNVTDDQLRALAARGGVLGIPFATAFLDEDERAAEQAFRRTDAYRDAGRGGVTEAHMHHGDAIQAGLGPFPIEHVVRHALHALEVAGPAHVAIGSDFDGIDRRPAGLEDASGYPALLRALADAGVDDDTLAAVAYGNAARALA